METVTYRLAGTAALILLALNVASAEVLDQSSVVPNNPRSTAYGNINSTTLWAESFTVGLSGTLTSVSVQAVSGTSDVQGMTLEVRPMVGGFPTSWTTAPLASASLPPTAFVTIFSGQHPFVDFDISSFDVIVHTGDQLAVDLRTTDPGDLPTHDYGWQKTDVDYDDPSNIYAGGIPFVSLNGSSWTSYNSTEDLGFATYVTVPEPSSLMLATAAILALAGFAGCRIALQRRERTII